MTLQIKTLEGEKIRNHRAPIARIIAMGIRDGQATSRQMQKIMEEVLEFGGSLQLFIGGSPGLSNEVLEKSSRLISFGQMTYPHQLFRIMVIKEIHRYTTN